jgi:hypothetical protein
VITSRANQPRPFQRHEPAVRRDFGWLARKTSSHRAHGLGTQDGCRWNCEQSDKTASSMEPRWPVRAEYVLRVLVLVTPPHSPSNAQLKHDLFVYQSAALSPVRRFGIGCVGRVDPRRLPANGRESHRAAQPILRPGSQRSRISIADAQCDDRAYDGSQSRTGYVAVSLLPHA